MFALCSVARSCLDCSYCTTCTTYTGSSTHGQLPLECRITLLCRDKANHVQAFHARLVQLHRHALNAVRFHHFASSAPAHLQQHTRASSPAPALHSAPLAAGLSPAPSSTAPPCTADRDALLAQLLAMGFAEHPAAHAAQATTSVESALEWLLTREGDPLLDLPLTTTQYSSQRVQGAGVSGLLQREAQRAAATDRSLDQAFKDLDALMAQAGEMVALAQRFRGQLLGGEEDAEARALEADLVAMGIANPVTKDAAGKAYHRELARQVSVVQVMMCGCGGCTTGDVPRLPKVPHHATISWEISWRRSWQSTAA